MKGKKVQRHQNRGKWLNVYIVDRCYGGPEEGGWWWNRYTCLASAYLGKKKRAIKKALKKYRPAFEAEFNDLAWGDIYSMADGEAVSIYQEDRKAESQTRYRPYYC